MITEDGGKLPEIVDNRLQSNFIVEGVEAPLTDRLVNVAIKLLQ